MIGRMIRRAAMTAAAGWLGRKVLGRWRRSRGQRTGDESYGESYGGRSNVGAGLRGGERRPVNRPLGDREMTLG